MTTSKIQTGDKVKVIAGKYKGETGTVVKVYINKRKNGLEIKRVVVSGLPLQTAYQRAFKAAQMPGQMYTVERSLDISNVALVSGAGVSKVRVEKKDGKKVRILKKSGEVVIKEKITKKEEEKTEGDKKATKKNSKIK